MRSGTDRPWVDVLLAAAIGVATASSVNGLGRVAVAILKTDGCDFLDEHCDTPNGLPAPYTVGGVPLETAQHRVLLVALAAGGLAAVAVWVFLRRDRAGDLPLAEAEQD